MLKNLVPIVLCTVLMSGCDTLKDLTTASNNKPVINSFDHNPKELSSKDEKIIFTVVASDRDKKDTLEYKWTSTKGTLSSNTGETVNWSPLKSNGECDFQSTEGVSVVSVLVSDGNGGTANAQTSIRVKKGCESGGVISTPVTSPSPNSTLTPVPSPTTNPVVEATQTTTTPTASPSKSNYIKPQIAFSKLTLKEISGNGDNIANKGETFSIKVLFTNTGGTNTNNMAVSVSSSSEFVEITDFNPSPSNLDSLKPNQTLSTFYGFTAKLSTTVNPDTEIPLSFKLTDTFGNEYTTTGSFIVR